MYCREIVEEMLKTDELMKFRLKLYINLEGNNEARALKLLYKNVIMSDLYRSEKYSTLRKKMNV